MELDKKQVSFIEKRRKLVRLWPFAGTVLLLGWVAFFLWQYIRNPMLVNPYEMVSRLESGTIGQSTLMLTAVMLPLVVLMCFFMLTIIIIFVFGAVSNEKKYLKIIEALARKN